MDLRDIDVKIQARVIIVLFLLIAIYALASLLTDLRFFGFNTAEKHIVAISGYIIARMYITIFKKDYGYGPWQRVTKF